jgi:hypothetical protein
MNLATTSLNHTPDLNTLDLHDPGSQETAGLRASYERFDAVVLEALGAEARGQLQTAAINASVAASVAAHLHCGIFASSRLEELLNSIGRRITRRTATTPAKRSPTAVKRVLHVLTHAYPVGGVTKMLGLWLRLDGERQNSIVLTQHRGSVPAALRSAARASGAQIHRLNMQAGDCFAWAQRLREIAADYDAVVLHIHCEDIVPLLAFADPVGRPPVLLLNHADHLFWLGTSISDVVINLREAAQDISIQRRFTEPQRNVIIPTLVERAQRTLSRHEAKRAIGIDPNQTMLLSVARKVKFDAHGGVNYADIVAPVLAQRPEAILVVVGAGDMPEWRSTTEALGGRIVSVEETPNITPYLEAADIYVDSYPFVSSTSMMEAANYGMPLLTLFVAPQSARIVGINHVGLVGTALQATSIEAYRELLLRLIADSDFRTTTGAASTDAVRRDHTPPGWFGFLDDAYVRALNLPRLDWSQQAPHAAPEAPQFGEPDCRHQAMFGSGFGLVEMRKGCVGLLPFRQRVDFWRQIGREHGFRRPTEAASYLLPEWLKRTIKDRKHG